uniref:Fas (Tnfrsf6)-associated via death domain n=1 Tax=Nothobranchius korthausae TaxID=1143690 RepID=A0A1A8FCR8_9TELE
MNSQPFNSVLLEISNQLTADNLDKLKFLLRHVIGRRELEKIGTGHRLFEVLTERRKLTPEDTDFVSGLLEEIQRPDLSVRISSWGSASGSTDVLDRTEQAKLDAAFEVMTEHLGRNWRKLGRKLRISEVKLDSISSRHPRDLEETTMELLKEWRKSRGAEARAEELILALRDCQLNLTADEVEEKMRPYL